ncbi:maltose ABC transporter substrate-binding protein [Deinococcus arenae]|uniref:Maltose ABC transporter substrate-binding protein n=2 Tax=Deinococcus TaxID=1298 RepID=A0A8H9GJJ0_9DEIO|nr:MULTISPECIES: maltose ABC transporter substrate-binding protein [Deinococcus]ALW88829.1 sugar ABC transporter substrate-binding protein [Deinococcus actinosclerus]AWT35583.1 maltose ABC transporter substrate-binding protein [Deinococcus actinosclerus]GGM33647.1 maltose ABC transporter substrate-binding protein [Deinococcus arenae]
MKRSLTLLALALAGSAQAATLTVWTHFNDAAEVAWLNTQVKIYTRISGNTVKLVNVPLDKIVDQFLKTAKQSAGPDVIVTLPQDRIGQLAKAGVIEPMDAYVTRTRRGEVDQTTVRALTVGGKLYGLPMFAESVALVYNKKLVPAAPITWTDFLKAAKKNTNASAGRYGFLTDLSNAYMNYGFFSAYGSYVFGDASGTLDIHDIGLNNSGASKALALMNDLRFKDRLVPAGMTGDKVKAAFLSGKAAMIVTGPWDMGDIKKAGINYGIAAFPTPPGATGKWSPFVGVQGVVLNAYGTQKPAAAAFAEGLVTSVAQLSFNQAGGRIPVNLGVRVRLSSNPIVAGFGRVISTGTPMPNIPEMGQVWGPWSSAVDTSVQKPDQNYAGLLNTAVKTMQKTIK